MQLFRRCSQSALLLCLLALGLASSCDNRISDSVFNPALITELGQEALGDQIFDALTSSSSPYNVLSQAEHEQLYKYVDQLYLQSYRVLRATDNWTKERVWRLAIIEDEIEGAFTLPGGNIIITTGMLKVFRAEYELYYLLSFENALMNNEEIYISNLVSFIENTIGIEDLINNPDPARALEIGIELYEQQAFDAQGVAEIDRLAMELICDSGSWRNDGLIQFLNGLSPNSVWKNSRQSSLNRIDLIINNSQEIDCGNLVRERSLNFYVDNILPLVP